MNALISFLGGSAFRMIWGEVAAYFTRKQEHTQEIERMKIQAELEAAQHARNLEAMRVQAELGIKTIEAQRDAEMAKNESEAWLDAVKAVGKQTGIVWLDAWNGAVRPLLATLAILVVVCEVAMLGFSLTEWHRELVAAILGIYIADRSLTKRGK